MKTLRLALWIVAGVCSVAGVALLVLPPRTGVRLESPPVSDSSGRPSDGFRLDPALAEEVAVANIFSVRRTPPATRYAPPDASTDSSGGMVVDSSTPADSSGMVASGPVLFGTVIGAGVPRALLDLDAAAGPRMYAVGERDGGYRVLSISPRVVVLASRRGRVTLRLESEEARP